MNTILYLYTKIRTISRSLSNDKLRVYSAQASFFMILGFFPFLILLLTLIQFTPLGENQLLSILDDLTPSQLQGSLITFVDDIYNHSSITLISITAIAAIWASSSAFASIMDGLNSVFHRNETRNFFILRIVAMFYTVIFIILIVLSLSLLVFGNQLLKLLHASVPWLYELLSAILEFKILFALGLLTLFFIFLFKYIPNRKTTLVKELPGAFFSSLGWMVFSYIYSLYIDKSVNFSNIYGSLATLAFAMLWLYFCMYILFLGAEINKIINKEIQF